MRFILTLLLPCSVLAGGSVSVFIKDLGAVPEVSLETLNIQGTGVAHVAHPALSYL